MGMMLPLMMQLIQQLCKPKGPVEKSPVVKGTVLDGSGTITGDPHFADPDGGKFDVMGDAGKTYNILSDRKFQMNALFDKWGQDGVTVVTKSGFTLGNSKVEFGLDGKLKVNGEDKAAGDYDLGSGNKISLKDGSLTVTSSEYTVTVANVPNVCQNITITAKNALADGVRPEGLFGQLFDEDKDARNGDAGVGAQGGGAIATLKVDDTTGKYILSQKGDKEAYKLYEVSNLNDTAFKNFNKFNTRGSFLSSEGSTVTKEKAIAIQTQLAALHASAARLHPDSQQYSHVEEKIDDLEKQDTTNYSGLDTPATSAAKAIKAQIDVLKAYLSVLEPESYQAVSLQHRIGALQAQYKVEQLNA